MVDATYAKSHNDWEDIPTGGPHSNSSFLQVVFGSCSGVMDAASHAFSPSTTCHRANRSPKFRNKSRSPKSRRSKSPSLRKSEEVVEIPEFLNADIASERTANRSPTDDISALSSHTLDEMAKEIVLTEKRLDREHAVRSRGAGPPSPTTTEVSEDPPVPGYSYMRQFGMETSSLSEMISNLSPHSPTRTGQTDTSFRQTTV
mmetsp:Transcript_5947/g.9920  ORF Transcript_5947/g.9920 Transcript_5947/m.9920 type:complete len:202 (-) Transcript_5947:155-760(-)|eukprot:CAMPEP_0119014260 /NCGR_PEP_ID=MMETSP1176-20130426/9444_1 /TAXON_ID=265551 /ORGANISM="Synedropsis recta cf, Strain CCMP1620" /LENGTH=201 /DNA_ID=CAMNT_0006967415 /DNA_START=101 /DNA_END=706 /DNA_ORIENTATION=-